jgi:hypothetical protein
MNEKPVVKRILKNLQEEGKVSVIEDKSYMVLLKEESEN